MNEHDKLFRKVQSIKENAIDLIESTFPQDVVNILQLDSLTLDTTSYIDKRLKEYYSDLVYNCTSNDGKELTISILFEHKSFKPDNEYLQLLRYMLNIWEHQTKNKKPITPVIPVIFYHDTNRWIQRDFFTFFNLADNYPLNQFIPHFNYILTDIARYEDEVIKKQLFKRDFNKVMALLFKYFKNEDKLLAHLKDIFEILKDYIEDADKQEEILEFILYVMLISEIPEQTLTKIMNEVTINGGDTVMTTAMKIKREGKLEGKLEGRLEGKLEGKLEAAEKMLRKGFSLTDIAEITGLTAEEIMRINR